MLREKEREKKKTFRSNSPVCILVVFFIFTFPSSLLSCLCPCTLSKSPEAPIARFPWESIHPLAFQHTAGNWQSSQHLQRGHFHSKQFGKKHEILQNCYFPTVILYRVARLLITCESFSAFTLHACFLITHMKIWTGSSSFCASFCAWLWNN